ncbi:MAG: hypothetical protein AB8G77_05500 [Rhodothermales bacterium]
MANLDSTNRRLTIRSEVWVHLTPILSGWRVAADGMALISDPFRDGVLTFEKTFQKRAYKKSAAELNCGASFFLYKCLLIQALRFVKRKERLSHN